MKRFSTFRDTAPEEIRSLVELSTAIKSGLVLPDFTRKTLGLVFFNQSLRTRLSFEAAMAKFGGAALCIDPGGSTWSFETRRGVKMDGAKAEHLEDAVQVMSRYVDALAVRSFAALEDLEEDIAERFLTVFSERSSVPLISLESAAEHPCQMLADVLTMEEKLKPNRKRTFVLRWAPHVKRLPMAVPHSALLAGAFAGADVILHAPPEYDLHPSYTEAAQKICRSQGCDLQRVTERELPVSDADILYVKSWGAASMYGDDGAQTESFSAYSDWMVDLPDLGEQSLLMHCLPVRRDVVVSDAALDHERSIVIDQAENRLWAQLSILHTIFPPKEET